MATKRKAMNRFQENLLKGESGIKESRASLINDATINAQEKLINEKRGLVTKLKLELEKARDLGPKDTVSLEVAGGKEFNPDNWVKNIHNLKIQIEEAEYELDIALQTYKEEFSIPETDK